MISTRARRSAAALLAAATIGAAVAPNAAQAGGKHHRHGHGYGYGAAALGGGLLLGALIASNARPAYAAECWTERRRFVDPYGDVHFRKVRVCD